MQNKWFKILAIALCAMMFLTVAPTAAPTAAEDAEQHPTEAPASAQRQTDPYTEKGSEGDSKAPRAKGKETVIEEPLTVGENTFEITKRCETVFRPFTPDKSGVYLFYSVSDFDTYGELYLPDDEIADIGWHIDGDDDSGEDANFEFSHSLTAGRTYYLGVSCPYRYELGSVTVRIEKMPANACGNHLTWTFDEASGKLTINGDGSIWDYASSEDTPWYSYRERITSVSLPDGLYRIGNRAFNDCTTLLSVEIPDGVVTIAYYSFFNCSSLQSVTLPISMSRIYECAFDECAALSDVYYRGTAEQKDKMYIDQYDESNACLINAEWHYLGLPCPHKNAYDCLDYHDYAYEEVEDDLWHKVNYLITYYVYCPDCDQVVSTGDTEQRWYMNQHCYDDGVCADCGHVNACRHRNLETWNGWYTGEDPVFTDTGDDRDHQVSGQYYAYSSCRDCGWYQEELKTGTLLEPHFYGETGVCLSCGHEDACTHPDGLLYRCGWEKPDYEDYDDEYHLTSGWRSEIAYCPICLLDQFEGNWYYAAELEEHDYDSYGYCRACGHKCDGTVINGVVEWNPEDVQFKGSTPYVIANGSAQTPRFVVKNETDGSVVDPAIYDYEYRENTDAGTGYVIVKCKGEYVGTFRGAFKIYLPPTTTTTVANDSDGVKLAWTAVPGANGYVIYRRAWSSTTGGWTSFVRWNNTKDLTWTDTKVYAGTRYQYGIKAYFNRRSDPVAGVDIGGNVGDNFNLGEVGPLKTTVRITTRTLNSVTAGKKQMTVKWTASGLFTGYQVQIATNAAFSQNVKTVKITNAKTAQTVIKGLTSGKTYFARVRSYHVFNGTTYYGGWSNVLSCKVK